MNQLPQRKAVDEFHRDEARSLALVNFVDVRDVRMIQRGRGFCFLREAPHSILIAREFCRQNLQRDLAIELRVCARYTLPMPPSPIFERISYRPSLVPVSAVTM